MAPSPEQINNRNIYYWKKNKPNYNNKERIHTKYFNKDTPETNLSIKNKILSYHSNKTAFTASNHISNTQH